MSTYSIRGVDVPFVQVKATRGPNKGSQVVVPDLSGLSDEALWKALGDSPGVRAICVRYVNAVAAKANSSNVGEEKRITETIAVLSATHGETKAVLQARYDSLFEELRLKSNSVLDRIRNGSLNVQDADNDPDWQRKQEIENLLPEIKNQIAARSKERKG